MKFWEPALRARLATAQQGGAQPIANLNTIPTLRGSSPNSELYVDPNDGYARVLKAGSSINSYGMVTAISPVTDFIEKAEYDKMSDAAKVVRGDVLLSSTGDGTLGKAAVYDADEPAVADGHITIIRLDTSQVDPFYLADFLRAGFGREQINRLYTGSTGLIELTPQHVDTVVVPLPGLQEQRKVSDALRTAESDYVRLQREALDALSTAQSAFAKA